ncbi:MAG TPA: phosphatase PAP2 family protein [Steroidobacter sp.]
MDLAAELIARHVMLVLGVLTLLTLAATALFWRLAVRFGPALWSWIVALWDWLRSSRVARRLQRVPVIGPSLTSTLTAARYLGVVGVIGFLLAAAAWIGFFELADEIGVGESLAELDEALRAALSEHVSRRTLAAFAVITHLGDFGFLLAFSAFVLGVLVIQRRWLLAAAWTAATTSGGLLNKALKAVFERSRPVHEHGLANEAGWSFPSGHASGAMLVYGLLAYLLVRHTPARWHIPIALLAAALILFVGSSRVILQVHYLSDVLAGYASAAAWVALWIVALEALARKDALPARGEPGRTTVF